MTLGTRESGIEAPRTPDPFKAGSASPTMMLQAVRATLNRAVVAKLNGTQWRVLAVVLDRTAGFAKLRDRTYSAWIAEAAGFPGDAKRARLELRHLAHHGIIVYEHATRYHEKSVVGLLFPPADSC